MDIWKMVGSLALGVVVGLISRFFFERFEKFTARNLGSVLACVLGGTAIGYLTNWLKDAAALAVYPVGLLTGVVAYALIWPREPKKPADDANPISVPIKPSSALQTSQTLPADSGDSPTFTVLELKKNLRFLTKDGGQAHLQRLMKMRANARATDFWICTISADGEIPIKNILVDSSSHGVKPDVVPTSGQIDIYARFAAAIKAGEIIELRLEYDLIDSFPANTEYLGHIVQHQTQKVHLEVEFHAGRPCISGELHRKYAGDTSGSQQSTDPKQV